jgi:DNA-binding SARP family transcriptional activator
LEVRLLGTLAAHARGRVLPAPAHPQGPALLGWLALYPGEQHERGPIAALLWPDLPRANARTELRGAAWAIRRMLGPDEELVMDGRETIGLRCGTDLEEFERLAAAGEVGAAIALCRGELLADLGDEHGWVLAARAEHAERVRALRG